MPRAPDGAEVAAGPTLQARPLHIEIAAGARSGPIEPDLVEWGVGGPLPRIGVEGTCSAVAYARSFDLDDGGPSTAMILAGIELEDVTTAAALALSAAIMLDVSPQAPDPSDLIAAAKRVGEGTGLELVFVAASAFVLGGTTGEAADHRHNGSELAAALG